MIHRCEQCPGFIALKEYLEKTFEDYDIDDNISYTQWKSTDRTTLQTHIAHIEEFIELLVHI